MLDYIHQLASSPFAVGIMILLTNVASRYIAHEFSSNDEEYSQNILLRRFAIFALCFMGTKDLIVSFLLTAGFVILAGGLFRGKSVYAREGMKNIDPDVDLRTKAGLNKVDAPAYDTKAEMLFQNPLLK
jgi:hypothetical protein